MLIDFVKTPSPYFPKKEFKEVQSYNTIEPKMEEMDDKNKTRFCFTDKISIKGCYYVLSLDFDAFKALCSDKICIRDKIYSPREYYNLLQRNCKKWIAMSEDGKDFIEIEQTYKYSRNGKGRIYVKEFGIQSLQRDIRAILTGDYYYDIDIKNCHWNLLLCMINDYNKENPDDDITCNHIKKYCLNRDAILKRYKLDKHKLLVFLNIDKIHEGAQPHKFIKKIHAEKQEAFETFLGNDEFMKKYGETEPNPDSDNPISSHVNQMFCINENNFIQYAMKEEHTHLVPMFDGFMLDKSYEDIYTYELIDCCPKECLIKWDYKSNEWTEQDFIDFEYSNADKHQYTMMTEIQTKITADYSIEGEITDAVVKWLYSICGEDIIYYDNLIYNFHNGIYRKSATEKGHYELKMVLNKYITPHIYKEFKQYKDELDAMVVVDAEGFTIKAKVKKYEKLKSVVAKWNGLYNFITSYKTNQLTLNNYVGMSKSKQHDFL